MPATATQPRKRKAAPLKKATDDMEYGPIVTDIRFIWLKNIRIIDTFRLCLHFKDDFIAEVDFAAWAASKSAGPMRKPLRDAAFFSQVYLDHGALTWPNGYDLCPFTLRHWAEQGYCD